MDNLLRDLSRNLGLNILELRRKRGWSQVQLAKISGLPRSTLTNLESGSANPSLANIARICAALQVSTEEILAKPRGEFRIQRSGEHKLSLRDRGKAKITKLLPDPIPGMEMDFMELAPGARFSGVPHLKSAKEYLYCLTGALELFTGGAHASLEAGDVVAFSGDQHHSYANAGRSAATCISVVVLAPFSGGSRDT